MRVRNERLIHEHFGPNEDCGCRDLPPGYARERRTVLGMGKKIAAVLKQGILLVLVACQQAFPQAPPKPKKVPLYRMVMVCPKGKTLYLKVQAGMKPSGDGMTWQMIFEWRAWDGETNYWGSDPYKDAACFKSNPPPAGGRP